MSEWMPIETAPKDGTVVDLWWPRAGCRMPNRVRKEAKGGYVFYIPIPGQGGWRCIDDATHWMPLPESPGKDE